MRVTARSSAIVVDQMKRMMKCKCLSPQSRDKLYKRLRGSHSSEATLFAQNEAYVSKDVRGSMPAFVLTSPNCAKIVRNSFLQDGQRSLNGLLEKGSEAAWVRLMFECTKTNFNHWKTPGRSDRYLFSWSR